MKGDLAINVYALSIHMGEVIRKQVEHNPLKKHTCAGVMSAGYLFP